MTTETTFEEVRTKDTTLYNFGYGELKRIGNIPLGKIEIPLLEVLYINEAEFDLTRNARFNTSGKALERSEKPSVMPDFVFTYKEEENPETGEVRRINNKVPYAVSRRGAIKTGVFGLAGVMVGGLSFYEWLSKDQPEEKRAIASAPTPVSSPSFTNSDSNKNKSLNPDVLLETFGGIGLMNLFGNAQEVQKIFDKDGFVFTNSSILGSDGEPIRIVNDSKNRTFSFFEKDKLVGKMTYKPDPTNMTNPLFSVLSFFDPDGNKYNVSETIPHIKILESERDDTTKLISRISKIPEDQILARLVLNPPAILWLDKRNPQTGLALPIAVNKSIGVDIWPQSKKPPVMIFTRLVTTGKSDSSTISVWREKRVNIELEQMLIPVDSKHKMTLKKGVYFFGDESLVDIMTKKGVLEADELFISLTTQASSSK